MKRLVTLIFLQMLPATLVVAAIRPLFAQLHGGNVSMMHAFMALNMAGAIVAATPLAMLADRMRGPRLLLVSLAAGDALLLFACALPLATPLVLTLRFLEGAAHVGAASLLLAEAGAIARERGEGKVMGLAGAAIVFAIAVGNGLGGTLVALSPRTPFFVAAAIGLVVSWASWQLPLTGYQTPAGNRQRVRPNVSSLMLPLSAAFVERFAVGCVVVSFSLFAHARHALGDSSIGWLFFALTFTFAMTMAPAGWLSDIVAPRTLVLAGAMIYGGGLLSLAFVAPSWLPLSMIVAGAGAALTFAPSLAIVAAAGADRRAASMALLNSAGCLGMTLGTATSGIAIAVTHDFARPIVIASAALIAWSTAAWVGKFARATLLPYAAATSAAGRHSRTDPERRAVVPLAGARRVADGALWDADR